MVGIVKHIHMLTALLSIIGFILRGIWMMQDSPLMKNIFVKRLPHLNDTVLLVCAVTLAVMTHQYPGSSPWLTAKVTALLCYIGLGFMAFRFGKTKKIRTACWMLAIIVFTYMVGVAFSKNPAFFLSA